MRCEQQKPWHTLPCRTTNRITIAPLLNIWQSAVCKLFRQACQRELLHGYIIYVTYVTGYANLFREALGVRLGVYAKCNAGKYHALAMRHFSGVSVWSPLLSHSKPSCCINLCVNFKTQTCIITGVLYVK